MDRQIVYPGALPRSVDFAQAQQSAMIALGWLGTALYGAAPIAAGLAISPTSPASLGVVIGPGMLSVASVIEATAFGVSLPADTKDPLTKFGINPTSTALSFTPPTTQGQTQAWTIYAAFSELDTTNLLVPFYNSAQTGQQFSGPSNTSQLLPTQRRQVITINDSAGTPVTSGTPVGGLLLAGQVPLYTVTLPYGATAITAANIAPAAGSPFVPIIQQLLPGFSRRSLFTTATSGIVTWTCPAFTTLCYARIWGGGGAGSGSSSTQPGSGGGGGGYADRICAVVPGTAYPVVVGGGGAGGGTGSSLNGSNGTSSSFGTFLTAGGGAGGLGGSGGGPGGGGSAIGGDLNAGGGPGTIGFVASSTYYGGAGGNSPRGGLGGSTSYVGNGTAGSTPGGGGAGSVGGNAGGSGAAGAVELWY